VAGITVSCQYEFSCNPARTCIGSARFPLQVTLFYWKLKYLQMMSVVCMMKQLKLFKNYFGLHVGQK